MMHSLRRCSMQPQSLGAPRVVVEFAERVLDCIQLDNGWREPVLRALAC